MTTFKIPIAIGAFGTNTYPERIDFAPNIQDIPALIKDVDGSVYGRVRVPENYVSTPKIELGILANATSGVTRLTIGTGVVAFDAESWDVAFTDETAQDITVPATAYVDKLVTFTLTTTPAAGKWLMVRLTHNGAHANDTLAVNTLAGGVFFTYADV